MELIVLGSGTSEPHPRRSSSGYWVRTDGGTLLLDCSASSLHRMAQEGLDWAGLDAIWISHFHLDHCAGVAPYLFATRHAKATQRRTLPLRIVGPPGLEQLIGAFDAANDYKLLEQPFPVEIFEVEPLEKFEILPGVTAVAYSTPHTDESHAIHLSEGDTTMVYTSDTSFDVGLATFARRVDLFLMECSFVRNKPVAIHLELDEAIHLIRRAEPGRAVLTHLYSEWDEVDFQKEVERLDPGTEVIQAYDGLRVEVKR